MLARSGRSIAPVLALLFLAFVSPTARAQNIFNPYGNSGYADYRDFARPQISNDPSLPGQARLQGEAVGGSRANQFEAYSNSITGRETDATEGTRNGRPAARAGVPYFQNYRQYDEQYKRVYRPNDTKANRDYEDRMKQRNDAYVKALEEKDPTKRARLLRQIEVDTAGRQTSRATGPARPSAARAPAPTARAPIAPGTRAPAPPDRPAASPRSVTPTPPTTATPTAPASAATAPSTVPIPPPR